MLLDNWYVSSSSVSRYEKRAADAGLHNDFHDKVCKTLRENSEYYMREVMTGSTNRNTWAAVWQLERMMAVYRFIVWDTSSPDDCLYQYLHDPDYTPAAVGIYDHARMAVGHSDWIAIRSARLPFQDECGSVSATGLVNLYTLQKVKATEGGCNMRVAYPYEQYSRRRKENNIGLSLKRSLLSIGKWFDILARVAENPIWDSIVPDESFIIRKQGELNYLCWRNPKQRADDRNRHLPHKVRLHVRAERAERVVFTRYHKVIINYRNYLAASRSRLVEIYLAAFQQSKAAIKIVEGQEIVHSYTNARMHSCMSSNPNRCLKHYVNNPRIKLAVGYDNKGQIAWRALLWNIADDYPVGNKYAHPFIVRWRKEHPGEPLYYMDRQYCSDEVYLKLHASLLLHTLKIVEQSEGNWDKYYEAWTPFVYDKIGSAVPLPILDFNLGGKDTRGAIWGWYLVRGLKGMADLNAMPYMDTFTHYYADPWGGRWRNRTAATQSTGNHNHDTFVRTLRDNYNNHGLGLTGTQAELFKKLAFPFTNGQAPATFALAVEYTPQNSGGSGLTQCVAGYDINHEPLSISRNSISYNRKYNLWASSSDKLYSGEVVPNVLRDMLFENIIACQIDVGSPELVYARNDESIVTANGTYLRYALIHEDGVWMHPREAKGNFAPLFNPSGKDFICLRK